MQRCHFLFNVLLFVWATIPPTLLNLKKTFHSNQLCRGLEIGTFQCTSILLNHQPSLLDDNFQAAVGVGGKVGGVIGCSVCGGGEGNGSGSGGGVGSGDGGGCNLSHKVTVLKKQSLLILLCHPPHNNHHPVSTLCNAHPLSLSSTPSTSC